MDEELFNSMFKLEGNAINFSDQDNEMFGDVIDAEGNNCGELFYANLETGHVIAVAPFVAPENSPELKDLDGSVVAVEKHFAPPLKFIPRPQPSLPQPSLAVK